MTILIQEKHYLKRLAKYIHNRKNKLIAEFADRNQKTINDKRDIYQTISTNDLADLAFRRTENEKSIIRMEDNQKEILKLQAIEDSPYFGYVEFCEDGESETESIHIGFQGITTSQYESLIYDWRTPIASLYYDYPVGRASFFVPSVNNKISGLNKYKAQIIIKDQIIQKILPTTDTPNEDALLYAPILVFGT